MLWSRIGLGAGALFLVAVISLVFAVTGYPSALKPMRPAPGAIQFDNVRLISMTPGAPQIQDEMSVLVVDGAISAVGPRGSTSLPDRLKATEIDHIDGAGRTLMPGLIDAHVHIWDESELAGYLAHGVTGVRNMSGMPFHLPLAKRIEGRRILGPELITTGPILNSPGPNQQDNHQLVETADEARQAVAEQYDAGYRALKVYSNLRREAFDAIVAEAAKHGMSVSGHTPEGVRGTGVPYDQPFDIPFSHALGADYQTIEHVESIVWHGLRDQLDEEAMRVLAAEIAAAEVAVTPTLIAHDNLVRVAETKGAYLERPGAETVNPLLRMLDASTYEYWSNADPETREAPRAAFYLKATKALHDAGVSLVAGTDAGIFTNIPGSAMTRELELLVKAGLSPYEALETATVNAAGVLHMGEAGQIAPGYRANLMLVDGNPLENISLVENPDAVMIRGVLLDENKLSDLRSAAAQTSLPRSARRAVMLLLSL